MTEPHTFLFHDYETWGTDPKRDYPCQFAAIRTDLDLNPVEEPINLTCRIPNDYLPHPLACIVTGITPQFSVQNGLNEAQFARKIAAIMNTPNTCALGYNSMRFDDEVTRFLFYRNFIDPYKREWKNGNSRWDIIDLARACYALRPDGIQWAYNEQGHPTFKLEALTAANGIDHAGAHDALVDVRATIALAKLIKLKQPKLFDYGLSLRQKQNVWSQLTLERPTPLLHVSAKIPASQGCCTWILPIAIHPHQPNAVICIDLSKNTSILIDKSVDYLKDKLYAPRTDISASEDRPGLKLIHVNKSPFITSAKALTQERAETIGLDKAQCLRNYQLLIQQPIIFNKVLEVFSSQPSYESQDAEQALYSDGFMSDFDKRICMDIQNSDPNNLAQFSDRFERNHLKRLLFLYRGRNYPDTLSEKELTEWQHHRQQRLLENKNGLNMDSFANELDRLAQTHYNNPKSMAILNALHRYAQNL